MVEHPNQFDKLLETAESGDANAEFELGVRYAEGCGVDQSDEEAVKWYRKAAENGNVNAQFNLGICYAFGDGVPKSEALALKWYGVAARNGDAEAARRLKLISFHNPSFSFFVVTLGSFATAFAASSFPLYLWVCVLVGIGLFSLFSLVRSWRWPTLRPYLEVGLLILVTDIVMSFLGDRPIPNEPLFYLWLGANLLLLPIVYGAVAAKRTRKIWYSSLCLLFYFPFMAAWLFFRDYLRFPEDVSLASFLPVGMIGLIEPVIQEFIRMVVSFASSFLFAKLFGLSNSKLRSIENEG